MKSIKEVLLAVVFLYCSVNVPSYAASAAATLTQLLLNIKTMQADFTQTVTAGGPAAMQPTHGHMALSRPGNFRWQITQPVAQLIIAHGPRLWVYDVDLEQVTIRSLAHAAGLTPALLLSASTLTLSKDYRVQPVINAHTKATAPTFLLEPKDPDEPFAAIWLSFQQQVIRSMRLADRLGHITEITFNNVRIGTPLAAELFTFKPAPNIDVIDETKQAS